MAAESTARYRLTGPGVNPEHLRPDARFMPRIKEDEMPKTGMKGLGATATDIGRASSRSASVTARRRREAAPGNLRPGYDAVLAAFRSCDDAEALTAPQARSWLRKRQACKTDAEIKGILANIMRDGAGFDAGERRSALRPLRASRKRFTLRVAARAVGAGLYCVFVCVATLRASVALPLNGAQLDARTAASHRFLLSMGYTDSRFHTNTSPLPGSAVTLLIPNAPAPARFMAQSTEPYTDDSSVARMDDDSVAYAVDCSVARAVRTTEPSSLRATEPSSARTTASLSLRTTAPSSARMTEPSSVWTTVFMVYCNSLHGVAVEKSSLAIQGPGSICSLINVPEVDCFDACE